MQKSLNIILKQQKELEFRITQILDEKRFHHSLYMRNYLEDIKNRELEEKIQELKEENQSNLKKKILVEAQMDILRQIQISSTGTLSPIYFQSEENSSAPRVLRSESEQFMDKGNSAPQIVVSSIEKVYRHSVDKLRSLQKMEQINQVELKNENVSPQEPQQKTERREHRISPIVTPKFMQYAPVQDISNPEMISTENPNQFSPLKNLAFTAAPGMLIEQSSPTKMGMTMKPETKGSNGSDDTSPDFGITSPTLKVGGSLLSLQSHERNIQIGQNAPASNKQKRSTFHANLPLVIVKSPSGRTSKIIRSRSTEDHPLFQK